MFWRILLCVVLITIPLSATAQTPRDDNPHDFRNRCRSCHLTEPSKGEAQVFTKKIDDLCNDCHHMRSANSHPSMIRPEMTIPGHLP